MANANSSQTLVGQNYDLIITVKELKDSLPENTDMQKVIFIDNFFKKDEIEERLKEKLLQMKIIGDDTK